MQLNFDADSRVDARVHDQLIQFRPSPNFKNMKKFLKSRMGDADSNLSADSPESPTQHEDIQPPLPLEPPPHEEESLNASLSSPNYDMDDKSVLLAIPKQERTSPEPEIKCEMTNDYEETKPPKIAKPLNQICKDFIRGNCSWVGCKYRHEIDLTQLRGIFIFCHNFQNSVCNKPNCRYVHASVFDEQKFYRTGELPKVLMQKPETPAENVNATETPKFMLPPPPPPPPPPTSEAQAVKDPTNNFVLNVSKPPPVITAKSEDQLTNGIFGQNPVVEPKSPRATTKRPWSETDEGFSDMFNGTSPQDNDSRVKRSLDAKCGSCKVMENRLKFSLNKLQDIMKSARDSELKMAKLEKKHKFLIQLACTIALHDRIAPPGNSASAARSTERENASQPAGSIFSQIDLQHALQQANVLSDNLGHLKEEQKKISSQQASNLAAQLKNFMQAPPLYNKINNNDDNGSKAYHLSNQHVAQQQPSASSNMQYLQPSGPVNNVQNDQNSVRHGVGPARQLSNLFSGW